MRFQSLIHILESVMALSRPDKIYVLGSASLLVSFPEIGEDPGPLDNTFDADLLVDPVDGKRAALLSEALGIRSLFRESFGYHGDILHPDIIASFPTGWAKRLVQLPSIPNVLALDPHDLGIVKVCVGREKDLSLVRTLLTMGKLKCPVLRSRFKELELGEKELFRASRNLHGVCSKWE